MNEDTKAIVASNLTVAYCSALTPEKLQSLTPDQLAVKVSGIYEEFIEKLTPPPDPDAGKVEHGEDPFAR